MQENNKVGAVLVIGGGIAGMQAAMDLATSGYQAYLVDRAPAIGGLMPQLDKTFPTNDCAMCLIAPKEEDRSGCMRGGLAVQRHPNIKVWTNTEVQELRGEAGNFQAVLQTRPRYIDSEKCIACGECSRVCPERAINDFNAGLDQRTAAYLTFPQAVPRVFAIDAETCTHCGLCVKVCPSGAVNCADHTVEREIEIGAVVLAAGNETYDPSGKAQYLYGRHPNVLTSIEFERSYSGTGPYGGHLLRPSDRQEPKKIAWLQCIGSREVSSHSYCSAVCCMYAIKEAMIAKDWAHEEVDTAIFFMDRRTCGKGYEQYYERARQEYGVRFIRYRVPYLTPVDNGDISIIYYDESGQKHTEVFNLVVLSVGFEVRPDDKKLMERLGIELNRHNYPVTSPFVPVATSRTGVYVCGMSKSPKDIPESVTEASAAAAGCGLVLHNTGWTRLITPKMKVRPVEDFGVPRIGVYVCNCGADIREGVDVAALKEYAATLPDVVYVEENSLTCGSENQAKICQDIAAYKVNRLVVAGCSPSTHEPLFRETLERAGLNKYLFEMANIRYQAARVHLESKDRATEKAKDILHQAVARVKSLKRLADKPLRINQRALVVGGGIAGLTAGLNLAQQGFGVYLVEKQKELGGLTSNLHRTIEGMDIQAHLTDLIKQVKDHPGIEILVEADIVQYCGYKGNFRATVAVGPEKRERHLEHGAAVIATGGQEARTSEFLYGQHPEVMTQLELEKLLHTDRAAVAPWQQVVMIQCVGSRNADNPNCSRVCCQSAVKHALELKKMSPEMDILILYRDLQMYGLLEDYFLEARDRGVLFERFDLDRLPRVSSSEGRLEVNFVDPVLQRPFIYQTDAVILSTGAVPADIQDLEALLPVQRDEYGFLVESHPKLRPVDGAAEGIYLCGLAHSPKPMNETIAQALAAVAPARLLPGQHGPD